MPSQKQALSILLATLVLTDKGDTIMCSRRDNSPSGVSHHASMHTLAGEGKEVNTEQAVFTLQVGSQLDPGIKRKHKPNEDTLLVTQGIVPSASPSTPPKPFALLIVADGVGGQAHGQEASRLAVQSLAKYVTGSLGSQQMKPEAFLYLLTVGVQYANLLV